MYNTIWYHTLLSGNLSWTPSALHIFLPEWKINTYKECSTRAQKHTCAKHKITHTENCEEAVCASIMLNQGTAHFVLSQSYNMAPLDYILLISVWQNRNLIKTESDTSSRWWYLGCHVMLFLKAYIWGTLATWGLGGGVWQIFGSLKLNHVGGLQEPKYAEPN